MSSKVSLLEKYHPKTVDDIIGNKTQIKNFEGWIKDFKNKKTGIKRAVLLTGPSGIGKTLIATKILTKFDYKNFEFNASDVRSHKSIREKLDKLIYQKDVSIITNNKKQDISIIMDEIDGMGVGDKGGLTELIKIINPLRGRRSIKKQEREEIENRWIPPIICISNNIYDKKINELKKDCFEVKLEKIDTSIVYKFLNKIAQNENINIEPEKLKIIVNICDSDLRRALIILDDLNKYYSGKEITTNIINTVKKNFTKENVDIDLFESTSKVLNKSIGFKKGLNLFDTERCLLPLMVHENYINFINSKDVSQGEKLDTMINISKMLCLADVIDKYIYTNQCWDLQDLQGICSCVIPSYMINKLGKSLYPTKPNFTVSLGKTSLQYTNHKTVEQLIQKTGHPDFKIENMIVLYKKCLKYLNSTDEGDRRAAIKILNNYNLNIDDLDRLTKVNKQNTEQENLILKSKNKFKNIFSEYSDKSKC